MPKKTKGKFEKSGRRKRSRKVEPRHAANDKVLARIARFAIFDGSIKNEDVCDGPGQALVAGLLDNPLADPKAMRDKLREYADLYWSWYTEQRAKSANLERSDKGFGSDIPNLPLGELIEWFDLNRPARERRFLQLDALLTGIARDAVHDLCVNYYGSDEISPWLERLIAFREAMKGRTTYPQVAGQDDFDRWARVKDVLIEMVQGEQRNRRAA